MTPRAATQPKPILDTTTRALLAEISADPLAPATLSIVAPGGYGKSVILQELAETYRRAGLTVVTTLDDALAAVHEDASDAANSTAILIDDAHCLGESALLQMCELAANGRIRLAVAHRPWPRSTALARLTEAMSRGVPPLLPGRFDREQTRTLLTSSFSLSARVTAQPSLVEFVHAQAGGVPRYVARLAAALDTPGDAVGQRTGLGLPRSAIDKFRYDLDQLDRDLQLFLLALEAGAGLQIELLTALLDRDTEGVGDLMQAARATGLLGDDGMLLPISRRAVGSLIPTERRIGVRVRLAELQLDRGGPVLGFARPLLGAAVGSVSTATIFRAAAYEAQDTEPELAADLFAAAVTAGSPLSEVASSWARASALAGDLDSALRLADQIITAKDSLVRADGAQVAAAALAHRGQLGRCAELYRWSAAVVADPQSGSHPQAGSSVAFATIGLIGTGQLAAAEQLAGAAQVGAAPPTLLAGAASLMAEGVRQSVSGSTTTALSTLVRAAGLLEPTGQAVLLPDSPAALAALVALHCGELTIAASVLARSVAANTGGTLMSARHRLLQGWIAMVRGQIVAARECLASVREAGKPIEPRDELFAIAIEVGVARRNSDLPALRLAWGHACEAVMRHPVDLFTLLPLGEFAMAAARLRDQSRLAPHLQEARSLLRELGNPSLWSTQLHWSGLHAAIIAEQSTAAEGHAVALAENARSSRYCAVMSAAAECWLAVVGGKADATKVEAAARGLQAVGLGWDGARLAGQAAIRTSDRKAMVRLLECARQLQGRPARPASAGVPASASGTGHQAADVTRSGPLNGGKLSEREREVASLVLAGLTYKQVGDRLFISAKTVEHHMARMRQRLGATSRSDLLAQLRAITGEPR